MHHPHIDKYTYTYLIIQPLTPIHRPHIPVQSVSGSQPPAVHTPRSYQGEGVRVRVMAKVRFRFRFRLGLGLGCGFQYSIRPVSIRAREGRFEVSQGGFRLHIRLASLDKVWVRV